ncbi:hypothetical protein B0H13DRAFT_2318595 [Mycena leptocephala]|nr:hypothetical protein B0H13DRAFT_2318595 [Mycena leptocephala]
MPLPLTRFAWPGKAGTLASGTPHEDFAPTRDASVGTGSSFTYKDCTLEFPPSELARGTVATYYPSVFGEVAWIGRNETGFTVELTRPREAERHVADCYDMQLRILQSILVSEITDDSDVVGSWFGAEGILKPVNACFTIQVYRNTTDWIIGEDISIGSLLGFAWLGAVRFLRTAPDGPDARRVLGTMDARQLFRVAISSYTMYAIVARYLDHLKDFGIDEEPDDLMDVSDDEASDPGLPEQTSCNGGPSTAGVASDLDRLPAELGAQILRDLDLADRLRYAQVSRASALTIAAALQTAATEILVKFDLRFSEIRLMLTATGSLISGSTIAVLTGSPSAFCPTDLDVYTPRGGGWKVVQFFKKGGKYRVTKATSAYDFAAGIGKVFTLRHRASKKTINIIESISLNPLDAVLHFHLSCVFGAWTANHFWHGYPRLTIAGMAITTPSRLPLRDDIDNHKHVWKILRKYKRRSFTFSLDEFLPPHTCGIHPDCPMTPRTTGDSNCLKASFPEWEFQRDARSFRLSSWNMGGSGCQAGILSRAGSGNTVSASHTVVEYWKSLMRRYITLAKEPEEFVSLLDLL